MKEKEISQALVLKYVEVENYQFVINGQPQVAESTVLCCPHCGFAILNLGIGHFQRSDVLKYLEVDKERYNNIHYCMSCGGAIHFPEIVDIKLEDIEEIKEE